MEMPGPQNSPGFTNRNTTPRFFWAAFLSHHLQSRVRSLLVTPKKNRCVKKSPNTRKYSYWCADVSCVNPQTKKLYRSEDIGGLLFPRRHIVEFTKYIVLLSPGYKKPCVEVRFKRYHLAVSSLFGPIFLLTQKGCRFIARWFGKADGISDIFTLPPLPLW